MPLQYIQGLRAARTKGNGPRQLWIAEIPCGWVLGSPLSPVSGCVYSNHQVWSTWGEEAYRAEVLGQQEPRQAWGRLGSALSGAPFFWTLRKRHESTVPRLQRSISGAPWRRSVGSSSKMLCNYQHDWDWRASHPLLRKMCPKAGGKEELAPNIYLLHASSPPSKGEEPKACPGDLTDVEL